MRKRTSDFGFTLLEVVIVLAIFGVLMGAIFASISTSRKGWEEADHQIVRQQEARKALDRISWELRTTNPEWDINSTLYSVSINAAGDQIDFYRPVFDAYNDITELRVVRYYLGGTGNTQLLRREGTESPTVVANDIGTQKPFFSFANPPDTSVVDISIPVTKNGTTFALTTRANLRNREVDLEPDTSVVIIPTGSEE